MIASTDLLRHKAALILVELEEPGTIEFFVDLLRKSSSDSDFRYHLCGLLRRLPSPQSMQALADHASHDPDADVRFVAIFGLGKIGDGSVLPLLRDIVEQDRGTNYEGAPVSHVADQAIAKITDRGKAAHPTA